MIKESQSNNPSTIQFIADAHLGKLARYLRLLGFDTVYLPQWSDAQLIELAREQRRIILTKDKGILEQHATVGVYGVKATAPHAQLREVMHHFQLADACRLFTRCLVCNGELLPVDKQTVIDRLPPQTKQYYDKFLQCRQCARIYWQGSHYQRMYRFCQRMIDKVKAMET